MVVFRAKILELLIKQYCLEKVLDRAIEDVTQWWEDNSLTTTNGGLYGVSVFVYFI